MPHNAGFAKETRRRSCLAHRAAIASAIRRQAAIRVAALGCCLLAGRGRLTIAGYSPVGTELDPRPLMQDLERRGHQLALPVVAAAQHPLIFRGYASGDALIEGEYAIPIPAPDAPTVRPDILLVPGVAFDSARYRLGYGGGYYDRTLRRLSALGVEAIGLAFAAQIVDALPRESHDVPMTVILTESGVLAKTGGAFVGRRAFRAGRKPESGRIAPLSADKEIA